jgi:two-component sensor histidine kinase
LGCTNSEITLTKASGTWTLPAGMNFIEDLNSGSSSYNTTSATAIVGVSNIGNYSPQVNGTAYQNYTGAFVSRALPALAASTPTIVCEGDVFPMSTPTSGTQFEWVIIPTSGSTAAPTAIFTTSVASWPTPITGITSLGQVLWANYDKFNEEQRRNATKDIADSSERLTSLVNNLIDLSKLNNINYQLNKSQVNLTDLVHERLELCKKLYIQDKDKDDLWFNLQIEDELTVLCDQYYISRTIDNIIVNAIQYCKQGTITIELKLEQSNTILFSVKDEGIGIPKDELFEVFDPFTVSSKTKTSAGGRGIGLALSKKVIEAHNGQIWAKPNQDKGVTVAFSLPING